MHPAVVAGLVGLGAFLDELELGQVIDHCVLLVHAAKNKQLISVQRQSELISRGH